MTVRVVTAAEAAELEQRAIADGTLSRELMRAAAAATAQSVLQRFAPEAARGVAIYAGVGNNGGDAWRVGALLARSGLPVRVHSTGAAQTADAQVEQREALAVVESGEPDGSEGVVIDGLLGTGATGAPRDAVETAIRLLQERHRTARVVAVDVPSGVNATTGECAGVHVRAHLTVTYGSLKRGVLRNRAAAGAILVADIGLGRVAAAWSELPSLVDAEFVRRAVPPILADAHKGTRRRLLVVGGAAGMAGAPILAARGAMRSGIGMVKLCVAPQSLVAVQGGEPAAMAAPWPTDDAEAAALGAWAHALLIGPGLGRSDEAAALIARMLGVFAGPVVLDADALNAFEGRREQLAALLNGRTAVITPHAVEFARLIGGDAASADEERFDAAQQAARDLRCTVLLKGVPTVIANATERWVSAAGTPALATAGSGDVLGGIVATLLAQTGEDLASAAAGAWAHGRAAEIAGAGRGVRGVTLDDVLRALPTVWQLSDAPRSPPWLAELAPVAELPTVV